MTEQPEDQADDQAEPLLTGDPVIDEALVRLDALDERPVHEHPAEFEHVHRVLRDALSGR